MKHFLCVLGMLAVGTTAGADDVILTNGGHVSGVIVEQDANHVVVDIGPGLVTLPMSRVKQVKGGPALIGTYRDRAARLGPSDVEGWLKLAQWAEDNALRTQAGEAYQYVVRLDPANVVAHAALGDVHTGGRWVSLDESYRERGYVRFEGSWVSPDQQQQLVAQRTADEQARRQRIEDDLRQRELEARTRLAESELEARRSQPAPGYSDGGIPYGYVIGGSGCTNASPYCVTHQPRPPRPSPPPPVVHTPPPHPPPTADTGSNSRPPRSAHAAAGPNRSQDSASRNGGGS